MRSAIMAVTEHPAWRALVVHHRAMGLVQNWGSGGNSGWWA